MAERTIQLMATCLVDRVAPEVGKATVKVLEDAGCEVKLPADQTCCGQPAFNVGLVEEARKMARHTLDVFDGGEEPIVVPSGSCAAMVAHHYRPLLDGTNDQIRAERVAERVVELSSYLADDLEYQPQASSDRVVTVHRSCHGLRTLGLSDQIDRLIADVDGASLVPLDGAEECCGFGGLFSVEMPEVSAAILKTKLDRVEASGADTLVAGDISCLLHIEGGLRRRPEGVAVRHFIELLGGEDGT